MPATTAASLRRLLLATAGLAPVLAGAQPAPERLDDYVVTATRTPVAATASGSAVTVVDAADLARRQLTSLRAALGGVPGAPS